MQQTNIHEALQYDEENIVMDELLTTPFTREIRIAMYAHQVMRDHESDYPVGIEVCEGAVVLTTEAGDTVLPRGEIVIVERGLTHHIEALQESLLRLTIYTSACDGEA